MASLGNHHCANCIGTLSFPMANTNRQRYVDRVTVFGLIWPLNRSASYV